MGGAVVRVPEVVYRLLDSARLHDGIPVLGASAGAATLALQLSGTRAPLHWLTTGMLASTAVACAVRTLSRSATSARMRAAIAGLAAATAVVTLAYLGMQSPASIAAGALVWLGTRHMSLPRYWVYVIVAGGCAGAVLLALVGALDPGSSALAREAASPVGFVALALAHQLFIAAAFRAARLIAEDETATVRLSSPPQADSSGPHSGHMVGDYFLGPTIGRGGMGHVYRAERITDRRPVAVKVVNKPSPVGGHGRFAREVQSLREVRSPHVVEVLDWGSTDDGFQFLAMELLNGMSLAALLHRHGRLQLADTVQLIDEVARGLEQAHRSGIVHRDIKPSNLFLSQDESGVRWKILDFGLCKNYELHNSLTRGFAIGTPGFMSPEQAFGERLDGRSDVFALAVVAYCALTGEHPFSGHDPMAIVARVIHQQPCAPSGFCALPRDVDLVLALGLAKRVSERFPDATAFARALYDAYEGVLDSHLRDAGEALLRRYPWTDSEELATAIDSPHGHRRRKPRRRLPSVTVAGGSAATFSE